MIKDDGVYRVTYDYLERSFSVNFFRDSEEKIRFIVFIKLTDGNYKNRIDFPNKNFEFSTNDLLNDTKFFVHQSFLDFQHIN